MPMVTKLVRLVTYHEGLPPIKSNDTWIMWFCEIAWQTKNVISPLLEYLRPQNLANVTFLKGLLLK